MYKYLWENYSNAKRCEWRLAGDGRWWDPCLHMCVCGMWNWWVSIHFHMWWFLKTEGSTKPEAQRSKPIVQMKNDRLCHYEWIRDEFVSFRFEIISTEVYFSFCTFHFVKLCFHNTNSNGKLWLFSTKQSPSICSVRFGGFMAAFPFSYCQLPLLPSFLSHVQTMMNIWMCVWVCIRGSVCCCTYIKDWKILELYIENMWVPNASLI